MNKRINIWWWVFSLLLISLTGCERSLSDNPVLPSIDRAKAPILHLANASQSDVVIDLDKGGLLEISWDVANLGAQIPIDYTLVATAPNGKSVVIPTTAGENKVSISLVDFNETALKKLELLPAQRVEITFVLTAKPLLDSGSPEHSNSSISSAPLVVAITLAAPPAPEYPESVYMIGAQFGDWDWGSDGVVEMIPVHSHSGVFWAIRYFADPTQGFKWNTKRSWGGDFNSLKSTKGFTLDGGNAVVANAGMYIVVVNFVEQSITIEPAQVYGKGDAFGGWDKEPLPFTVSNGKMTATTTGDGELRIYTSSAAFSADWWQSEFIILNGKIAYRGTGGDQERVPVTTGQVITLDFNSGTGTIQ